ncbi:MAG: hypothetical protein ACI81A_002135 [Paraglaciecola sp.]|jgi:hypothetical protein
MKMIFNASRLRSFDPFRNQTLKRYHELLGVVNSVMKGIIKREGIVIVLGLLWQWLLLMISSPDYSSFFVVIKSIHFHLTEGEMVANLAITPKRFVISFSLSMVLVFSWRCDGNS